MEWESQDFGAGEEAAFLIKGEILDKRSQSMFLALYIESKALSAVLLLFPPA